MSRTVLRGGEVFDGTGAAAFGADVAMEEGRIVEIGTGLTGDEVIDVTGRLVIPGLIDCHTHATASGSDVVKVQSTPFSMEFFEAADNLKKMLHSGVTTTRDAAGIDLGVKRALEVGLIPGPRVKIAITLISQTGGHGDSWNVHGDHQHMNVPHPGRPDGVVDGVDEMRKKVRELARAGADVIKVASSGGVLSPGTNPKNSQLAPDELSVAVQEAAAAGLDVMAHAQGTNGIKNAVRAGVRSIEHGVYLDDEAIELMKEHGTWLVPTLLAPTGLIEGIDAGQRVSASVEAKVRGVIAEHFDSARRAHAAGVKIAMGTDAGVFEHGIAYRELALLMQIGMTAQEAVVASTSSAAELLRIDDEVGTITPGKAADIVVLGGDDPWDLVSYRENLELVIQAGAVVADHR